MDRKALAHILISAVCGGCGIALMVAVATFTTLPLGSIPFATSIVLVAGAPRSPAARTKAVICGHLICATAGLAMHYSGMEAIVTVAVAVGLSIALMLAFDVFHPPAGITPLVIYGSALDWTFLLMPVLAGAIGVALLARTAERLQALVEEGSAEPALGALQAPVSAPSDRPISP